MNYRIGPAPRFHLPDDWPTRLAVNTGCEVAGDSIVAKADWRAPTADELATLTAPGSVETAFSLLQLPTHLLERWTETASRLVEAGENFTYVGFVRALSEFLHFKGLPLPPGTTCDIVVTAPGLPTTRGGLHSSVDEAGGILGLVNVGEEATAIAVLPVSPTAMRERLAETVGGGRSLAADFLKHFPDEPLVKIELKRGEGCWLPADGAVFDGWTVEQTQPGVLLMFRLGTPG